MSESSENIISSPPQSDPVINSGSQSGIPKVLLTPDIVQNEIEKTKFAREKLERSMEAKKRIRMLKRSQLDNSS